MHVLRALACAAATLLTTFAQVQHAAAQTAGAIVQGRVTDGLTSETLVRATVRIDGTSLRAVTDRDGRFRISGVPAGRQVLVITYRGRKDKSVEIAVEGGATLTETIVFDEPYTYNEGVTVGGDLIVGDDSADGTRRHVGGARC